MSNFDEPESSADDASQHQRQQTEFEIEFFRRVLARYPEHLEVLRQQAQLLTSSGHRAESGCRRRIARLSRRTTSRP